MSDTPESDNFEKHFPDAPVSGWKRIARRFEKEREELRRWRDAAVATGLYRADTDISTSEKWQSAQAAVLASLLSELEDLRRWKAEALSVMPPLQEIGQEIGVTFGQAIHDKILPELIRRRGEIERLRQALRSPHLPSPPPRCQMNGLFEYVGGPKCGAKAGPLLARDGHVWMEVYDDIRPEDFEDFPEGAAIVFRYRVDGDKLVLFSETVETDFSG